MTRLGGWSQPGIGALDSTSHREIVWGGADWAHLVLKQGAWISGAARDAGNTDTTVLRDGLILGKITSSGKQIQWDSAATDGSQYISSVLNNEIKAQDFSATNADRFLGTIVRAPLQASQLLIKGVAFNSATDRYLARRQMVAGGFIFDDDPMGHLAGLGGRTQTITAEDHTILATDNGKTFIYTHTAAAASTVTLPTILPGLEFNLLRGANSAEDFAIVSAEGDNLLVGNDVAADSVTWTTTGQMIGAGGRIRSLYLGSDLVWHVDLYTPPFGTGLTGGFAYSIATA